MAGDWACAGGAGEAAFLSSKLMTSPLGFLITIAFDFFGGTKVPPGAGLPPTLGVGVCETWLTLVMAGVEGAAAAEGGRSEICEDVRDMLTGAWG